MFKDKIAKRYEYFWSVVSLCNKDNNYELKSLWEGHLEENSDVLPVKNDNINQYEEYFKNASKMIKQRGELIAKKIKNVLDFIPNDKIIKILVDNTIEY